MWVEAINGPLRYRWPGGEVLLEPGRPVDLPDERAEKLLKKAVGKIRRVQAAEKTMKTVGLTRPKNNRDWLTLWRELARMTYGIEKEDPRFQPVMNALDQCDEAFKADNWPAFEQAANDVRQAIQQKEQSR